MKKSNYGLDAPKIVSICLLSGVGLLLAIIPIFYFMYRIFPVLGVLLIGILFLGACSALFPAITILLGSYVFKFRERDWLLALLPIRGDEQILDVGCGRGLLLIGAAKKLTTGKAIGIDIWCADDQTQNSPNATLENARLEGVYDRIEVITADARAMPFNAGSFDIVISSWALHNIAGKQERDKALLEIMRVLKPGGTVSLMDIDDFLEYKDFFSAHNFDNVELIGPRNTFGTVTYIVKATKGRN